MTAMVIHFTKKIQSPRRPMRRGYTAILTTEINNSSNCVGGMANLPTAGRFEPGLFGRLGAQNLIVTRRSTEFFRPIVLRLV